MPKVLLRAGCLQAWQESEVPTTNGCVETAYAVWL